MPYLPFWDSDILVVHTAFVMAEVVVFVAVLGL